MSVQLAVRVRFPPIPSVTDDTNSEGLPLPSVQIPLQNLQIVQNFREVTVGTLGGTRLTWEYIRRDRPFFLKSSGMGWVELVGRHNRDTTELSHLF